MKEYTTEFLRNVALVSHGGAGKTMLAEAFLHATGATTRLGKVEDGTAAFHLPNSTNLFKLIQLAKPSISVAAPAQMSLPWRVPDGRSRVWILP